MKRKIIRIDESRCNGCGLCVPNCAEGALKIIDGKARLVAEVYCDGLGACLGHCPQDALKVEERDADAFDQSKVDELLAREGRAPLHPPHAAPHVAAIHAKPDLPCGCPGSASRSLAPRAAACPSAQSVKTDAGATAPSALSQWPVQLMLVPPAAPYLQHADLLICADCAPFALGDFHSRYLAGRAVLVGCPKLDDLDFYRKKLREVFDTAKPRSITVLRMEVPCCGGIAHAVTEAHAAVCASTPLEIHTVGIEGGVTRQVVRPGA